ncbi:MAG: serine/threonine-protein kinase [Planctomycetota bacterium]
MDEAHIHRRATEVLAGMLVDGDAADTGDALDRVDREDPDVRREIYSLLDISTNELHELGVAIGRLREQSSWSHDVSEIRKLNIEGIEIKDLIGVGSQGVVFRAIQESPRRTVALKLLRLDRVSRRWMSRLVAEAHILARLEHPTIARLYSMGFSKDGGLLRPYLVMEYIEGEPLDSYLARSAVSLQDRADILVRLSEALAYAHARGVIHRDIKPANVLVQTDPHTGDLGVKLIDFGIAKVIDDVQLPVCKDPTETHAPGTLRYMSPERLSGRSGGGEASSDIYSLGVVGREMFEGRPSRSERPSSRTGKSGSGGFTEARMHRLLASMTASEPALRPQGMEAVRSQLLRTLQADTASRRREPLRHPRLRTVPMAAFAAIGGICSMALFIWFVGSRGQSVSETAGSLLDGRMSGVDSYVDEIGRIVALAQEGHHDLAWARLETLRSSSGRDVDLESSLALQLEMTRAFLLQESGRRPEACQAYGLLASRFDTLPAPLTALDAHSVAVIAGGLRRCGESEHAERLLTDLIDHDAYPGMPWRIRLQPLMMLAGMHWLNGEYERASSVLGPILERGTPPLSGFDRDHQAQAMSSLGVFKRSVGAFDEAFACFDRALGLAAAQGTKASSQLEYRIIRNRAVTALMAEDYEMARRDAGRCRLFWSATPEARREELAVVEFVFGSADLASGDVGTAAERLGLSLAEYDAASERSHRFRAVIANALAAANIELGLPGHITELADSAREIRETYGPDHPWTLLATSRLAGDHMQ